MAENTAQLQAKLKALTHGKVDIMLNADTFKSTTQILREMSAAWEEMTDIERSAALELMGGKRQANILASVIKNFETVEDVIETSANSAGSALAENETHLDSIQGKTELLTNSLQTMWNNALSSDFIKKLLDIANGFVKIIDKAGLLNTVITALFATSAFKKDGLFGHIFKAVDGSIKFNTAEQGLKGIASALFGVGQKAQWAAIGVKALNTALTTIGIGLAAIAITAIIKKLDEWIVTSKEATEAAQEAINTYKTANESLKDQKKTVDELAETYTKLSSGVNTLTNENIGLTTESYQEYLDVCNDIADMYPELVTGFDAQGNAILSLKGKIDELNEAYRRAQENAALEFLKDDNKENIWKTYNDKVSETLSTASYSLKLHQQEVLNTIMSMPDNELSQFYGHDVAGASTMWQMLREQLQENGKYIDDSSMMQAFNGLIDARTVENLDEYKGLINSKLSEINQDIASGMKGIRETVSANLIFDEAYQDLDAGTQGIVKSIINNLSPDMIAESGAENVDDFLEWFSTNIIVKLQDTADELDNASIFTSLKNFSNQMSKAMTEDNIGDFVTAQSGFDQLIKNWLGGDGNLEIDENDDAITKYLKNLAIQIQEQSKNYEVKLQMKTEFESPTTIGDLITKYTGEHADAIRSAFMNLNLGQDAGMKDVYAYIRDTLAGDDGVLRTDELANLYDQWVEAGTPDSMDGWSDQQIAAIQALRAVMQLYGTDIDTVSGKLIDFGYLLPSLNGTESFNLASQSTQDQITKFEESITSIKEAWNSLNSGEMTKSEFIKLAMDFPELMDGVNLSDDNWMTKAKTNLEALNETKLDDFLKVLQDAKIAMEARGEDTSVVDSFINYVGQLKSQPLLEEEAKFRADTVSGLIDTYTQYKDVLEETNDVVYDGQQISKEYYDSLANCIDDVEELNSCFDANNKSIVTNAKKLKQLIAQQKQNILNTTRTAKAQSQLKYYELYKQMAKLVNANGVVADSNKDLILSYYEEMKVLENTIAKYAKFEAQLLGNVTAYEKFQKAQETDTETDPITGIEEMAVALGEAFNTAELGTETARAAISGLVPESVYQDLDTVDEKIAAIYDYFKNGKLSQYLDITFDEEGNIEQAEMKLGNLRKFIEDGLANGTFAGADWQHFEFSDTFLKGLDQADDKLQYFADQFGVTKDVAFAVIEAINDHDVEWLNGDYGNLFEAIVPDGIEDKIYKNTSALAELNAQVASGKISAEEYAQKYQELTATSDELGQQARDNISQYQDLTNQINDQKTKIDEYTAAVQKMKDQGKSEEEIKASVEYQSLIEASGLYTELIQKRSLLSAPTELLIQFAIDNIDQEIAQIESDLKDKIDFGEDGNFTVKFEAEFTDEDVEQINKYKQLWEEKHELELETDPEETKTALEEIESSAQNALDVINAIDGTTITINTSSAVSNVTKLTDALKALAGVSYVDIQTSHMEPQKAYTETRSDNWLKKHYAMADGTAHASGDWGLPTNEYNALVGELGTEMVVDPHTGRYYTVGDNGAEMVDLPKDAIIFNHRQTEELLKNGHINSRGKAYAEGNAHVTIWPNGSSTTQWDGTGYNSWDDPTYELSEALDSAADSVEAFEETIDWIEIRMAELDEALNLYAAHLENASTVSEKSNIIDQMIAVNKDIAANAQAGADYYQNHADQYLIGMSDDLIAAAKNGAIAITEFTKEQDEATVNAITKYREFTQKAADLTKQAVETIAAIRDLAIREIDEPHDLGSAKVAVEDSQTEQLQNAIDYLEESGYVASEAYYTAMMQNSQDKIDYWSTTLQDMQNAFDEGVQNGEIIKYSKEWYENLNKLYEVRSELDAAELELEQFQNAINQIYWDNFDELINRLSYLRNETESLIELMSHDDMFVTPEGETYEGGTVEFWRPEDVTWTNEGIATMGLYAQQMELAEFESKQYAEAIDELNAQYNAGLISESEYLAQLDELKKKQYESIEAYHEAKDAIVDLVKARVDAIKDGIKAEIDAYSELIEKQKEALESEKDLYDFEKSIQESEKNISEINRQLAALENDNSMAAASERKRLRAELAEAEYELEEKYRDRSYEDSQNALDKEEEDFKAEKDAELEAWDEYLANVEQIVTDSLQLVQDNATGVYDTLNEKADTYGIKLNETVLMPWQSAELAIGDYSLAFDSTVSSNLEQLKLLKEAWQEVIDKMAQFAGTSVDNIDKANERNSAANYTPPDDTPPEQPDTPPTDTTISAGDTVRVDPNATNFSRDGGNGTKMASFVPGSSYTVMQTSGNEVLIGRNGIATGWVNKDDLEGHATGTTGVKDDELAWIDELGEELVLHADGSGRLSYLTKGTAVIPHDISENLMQLGQLDPSDVLARNTPQIGISPSVVNNTVELNMSIAEVVHIDEVTKDTIPDLTKAIEKQLDKYMKEVNNNIRKYAR